MTRRLLLAAVITALGAIITLVTLGDGLRFSFPLLLGVLLLADGALRFYMLAEEARGAEQEPEAPAHD